MTIPRIVVCPDCNRRLESQQLNHADTCPLGLALDRLMDEDREWFERHPKSKQRRRPIHWVEATDLRLFGQVPPDAAVTGRVVVTLLGPGLRARYFEDVKWVQP
jgi:hypothetical protein